MNEDLILKLVKPALVNNTITYDKFEEVFSMLSRKEQYDVLELLSKKEIIIVDDYPDEVGDDQEDEIIEVDDVFIDNYDEIEDSYEPQQTRTEPLIVRKNIKMDNKTIIHLIQEGNEQAKQDLCIKNKRLVDKCVNMYMRMFGNQLDFEDLEQVGMIGMLKAAERFDFNMSTEFSTYALYWIRQSITREICDRGFTVRIPVHKMEQISKICRLDSQYMDIIDRNERIKKIASESGFSKGVVEECLILYSQFLRIRSLDMPVGEEEESTLAEFVPIEDEITPEEAVINISLKDEMKKVLETLTDRERRVLRLRFGFEDGKSRTLEEVGEEFGVTRERIRQIEAKALRKLRHPTRSRRLNDYLN